MAIESFDRRDGLPIAMRTKKKGRDCVVRKVDRR